MSELFATTHVATDLVTVRQVRCRGTHAAPSAEEHDTTTRWVFCHRGTFLRHLGTRRTLADANQVLYFNAGRSCRVSHPVAGGDDCVSVSFAPAVLEELGGRQVELDRGVPRMRHDHQPLTPEAQALLAALRARPEALAGESEALALARCVLGRTRAPIRRHTLARQRMVERVKLVLQSNPVRRWSLSELAAEAGVTAAHLTETFSELEGVPLYRYQLRLRLARALAALPEADDLTALALDHGFASHSHFTDAFRRTYGETPSSMSRRLR